MQSQRVGVGYYPHITSKISFSSILSPYRGRDGGVSAQTPSIHVSVSPEIHVSLLIQLLWSAAARKNQTYLGLRRYFKQDTVDIPVSCLFSPKKQRKRTFWKGVHQHNFFFIRILIYSCLMLHPPLPQKKGTPCWGWPIVPRLSDDPRGLCVAPLPFPFFSVGFLWTRFGLEMRPV